MSRGCQDRRGKIWRIAAVFAASSALALSGCTSNTERAAPTSTESAAPTSTESAAPTTQTTAATAEKVDAIANTVPENIKSTGKLVVGVNIPYTPNEFKDPDGKIVGFDVDLMNAIASTLGLTAEYREADFAKIIPSIQGGTFNVGMSSFTDTKEREKTVDFVDYFSAGILWAQRPGAGIDPNNACGKKVAVQATTTEETWELPAKSKACTDAGKPPLEIVKFDGQDASDQCRGAGPGGCDVGGLAGDVLRHQAEQRQAGAGRARSSTPRPTAGRWPRARRWHSRCCRRFST